FEAFAEMGASLHPVEKVVRWRAEGERLENGGTYWAPFERAAARLLPGAQSSDAEDDLRIMNILVIDRVGPIGFSPVAEAYRNFGAVGVVLVLGLVGACLALIDTLRSSRLAVLTMAVVYVPILTNVRNSFVSVPAHCAAGLAIVLLLLGARHVLGSIVGRPYASSTYLRSEA
ncbi:MAG: O-antigen polysaccharide polymerase Wzy, partial [Vicinamibacterales bacterium]